MNPILCALVVTHNVWRRKIKQKEKTHWGFLLQQHKWQKLNHLEAKKLFLHLSSVTIAEWEMSGENNNHCVLHEYYDKMYRNSINILPIIEGVKQYRMKKSAENLFFDKRSRTQKVIMQMLPKERF